MAGTTISGSYYMPIDMYLRKNEMTCMNNSSVDDDAERLNQFMRQSLIDFREPPSIYDEDQHRYDTHSREKLNLRHTGDRNGGIEPWLPDGTFLDQIFLSEEGNRDMPDLKGMRDQIDMRVRDVPLYSDDDRSIPSKERSAPEMISARDKLFGQVQKRLQIFDTSKDYLLAPNIVGKALHGSSQLKKLIHDQTPDFLSNEASSNRNWQVIYSNTTPVGWQTTPDIVFKISRYDTPRKLADQYADSYENRIAGKLDTDFLVSFEGKNVPRSLALTMMEIIRQRKRASDFIKNSSTQYGESEQVANRQIKQLDAQMMELMRRFSEESGAVSANQLLRSERLNVSGIRYIPREDRQKKYKSLVGFQLADMIKKATSNRKLGIQTADDLRGQIAQTAYSSAIYKEAANRENADMEETNDALWNSLADYRRDEHMQVFNYAGAHPGKRQQMAGSHNMFEMEEVRRLKHPDIGNRQVVTANNMYAPDVLDYEKQRSLQVPMWNIGGVTQANSGIGLTTQDHADDDMRDLSSVMHTQPGRVYSSRM